MSFRKLSTSWVALQAMPQPGGPHGKHSKAHNARVIIRSHHDMWTIFIEDDGVGMNNKIKKSKPGENIGLSIMKERADHISANIQVESDPEEGTRIEFKFLVEHTYSPESIVNVL